MPRGNKPADAPKRQADATDRSRPAKDAGRDVQAKGWASAHQLHDAGKKASARRKVPSGPLGGLGRKTNLSRSS